MNWEAIGAVGEVLGALAVVISLIYVGIQIRQNTAEMRNASTQFFVGHRTDANFHIANSEYLAKLLEMGVRSMENLEPHEQFRFKAYCFAFFNQFDFAFHQYRTGRLEDKFWSRMEYEIPVTLRLPGPAEWWEQDKVRFTKEFVEYVDARVKEFEPPAGEDWGKMSNAMFVEGAGASETESTT